MNKTYQWISIVGALCVAVAAQLPLLKDLLTPAVLTVILVVTNVVSAVLPSIKGEVVPAPVTPEPEDETTKP